MLLMRGASCGISRGAGSGGGVGTIGSASATLAAIFEPAVGSTMNVAAKSAKPSTIRRPRRVVTEVLVITDLSARRRRFGCHCRSRYGSGMSQRTES
ncbi:Uncharacterised protein [Mycobacteroides abscessus subsp. abscessus]|nr:Uncharacterised protein [Mycobacteroides abscessus subsp. abscessus]